MLLRRIPYLASVAGEASSSWPQNTKCPRRARAMNHESTFTGMGYLSTRNYALATSFVPEGADELSNYLEMTHASSDTGRHAVAYIKVSVPFAMAADPLSVWKTKQVEALFDSLVKQYPSAASFCGRQAKASTPVRLTARNCRRESFSSSTGSSCWRAFFTSVLGTRRIGRSAFTGNTKDGGRTLEELRFTTLGSLKGILSA